MKMVFSAHVFTSFDQFQSLSDENKFCIELQIHYNHATYTMRKALSSFSSLILMENLAFVQVKKSKVSLTVVIQNLIQEGYFAFSLQSLTCLIL